MDPRSCAGFDATGPTGDSRPLIGVAEFLAMDRRFKKSERHHSKRNGGASTGDARDTVIADRVVHC